MKIFIHTHILTLQPASSVSNWKKYLYLKFYSHLQSNDNKEAVLKHLFLWAGSMLCNDHWSLLTPNIHHCSLSLMRPLKKFFKEEKAHLTVYLTFGERWGRGEIIVVQHCVVCHLSDCCRLMCLCYITIIYYKLFIKSDRGVCLHYLPFECPVL